MTDSEFSQWRPHPWHGLDVGRDPPVNVNAFIEITPFDLIKYEVDKNSGYLRVDRPQRTSSQPPALYGFIPRTYCGERVRALCPGAKRGDGSRSRGSVRRLFDGGVAAHRHDDRHRLVLEKCLVRGRVGRPRERRVERGVALDERQGLTRLDGWHHPFVNGIATFKPSQKYPRQVYFGNESNVNLAWQCDNAGEVFIKGIAYRVNFRK